MSLKTLENALRGQPQPVYVVIGDAMPLVEQGVQAIIDAVLPQCGLPAFNHATVRAGDGQAMSAVSAARTLPMMAERRLVVLRDIESANEALFSSLHDYVQQASPTTTLIITGTGFPKAQKGGKDWGTRIRNAVKKVGLYLKLTNRDARPADFVRSHAQSLGKSLGRSEAAMLVELVGDDLAILQREVEKIALFAGDADPLTAEHISGAGSALADAVIWDLTTALASGQADRALSSLHRLLEDGEASHKLISMIAWKYRSLLTAREMLLAGRSDDEVRKVTRMRWDEFKSIKALVRKGDMGSAGDIFERLARANRDMNSHRAGDRRIFEGLVLELVS